MKKNNYLFLSRLLLAFIISACSSDSETTISNRTSIDKNEISFYSEALKRPELFHINKNIDTLTTWGFYIQTPGGGGGSYKQLQYSSSGVWRDVEVSYYPDICVKKKGFPYGDTYFRARTLAELKFAKVENPSIFEASPWSESLRAISHLLEDGTPLTERDIVVQLNFIFETKTGIGLIESEMFNKFKAELIVNNKRYPITTSFSTDQRNGCRYTYNYSTQKGSQGGGGYHIALDIIDYCNHDFMSFPSASYSFTVFDDATTMTPLYSYNFNVTVIN